MTGKVFPADGSCGTCPAPKATTQVRLKDGSFVGLCADCNRDRDRFGMAGLGRLKIYGRCQRREEM